MNTQELNRQALVDFLATCGPDTKVYVGCDSERVIVDHVAMVDYIKVVVVHLNGKNGCRIFHEITRERDYDKRKDRPSFRLMNEAYQLSAFYLDLQETFGEFATEIHLDLNPDEHYASSIVIDQAIGYIKGTCGMTPLVKPEAFAASYCADRAKDIFARMQREKQN